MRAIIWLVLLFASAVVAAAFLGANDALVTVFWAPWRVDVSFNLFVLGLVAWIGWTIATVHVEAEGERLAASGTGTGGAGGATRAGAESEEGADER